VKDQPELVGIWFAARSAVGGELSLVPFDEVLGLAATAIDALVKKLCRACERGGDVAHVEAFLGSLDAGGAATLLSP
jgi:hypothetical protein